MKIDVNLIKGVQHIEQELDLKEFINSENDILDIKSTNLVAKIKPTKDKMILNGHVDTEIVMPCAKTLKPVNVPLSFEIEALFSSEEDADYPLTSEIDVAEIVYSYIVMEKPYIVYHEDAKNISFEEPKDGHPAFSDLKDLYKK